MLAMRLGAQAAGLRALVAAAVGAARGAVGDRRVGESRDGPADVKKNGVTGRKVADWVIPPKATAPSPRRTKADWAREVGELLEGRYAGCERITLVSDNLNTHTRGAFYEVFEPARARAMVRRIEFCHTPKHGSWLNMAESEFGVLARQCLNRRLPDTGAVAAETAAWVKRRNTHAAPAQWQFTTEDARTKLHGLYPSLSE